MRKPLSWALASLCLFGAGTAWSEEPVLRFFVADREVFHFSAADLKKKIASKKVTFLDPEYNKVKTYECLPPRDVFALAYGKNWRRKPEYSEVTFKALDGYRQHVEASVMNEEGGCLAIRDADFPYWEPLPKGNSVPAPFYLTWTLPDQTDNAQWPRPYQLVEIVLEKFEDRYPGVVPRGAKRGSKERRGYEIFKSKCFSCHSIDREGGKVGPDLNAPKSVTQYFSPEVLRGIISEPEKYRYGKMPNPRLAGEELEAVISYLEYMRDLPRSPK